MNRLTFRYPSSDWHDCAQFVNLIAGYYGKRHGLEINLLKTDDPEMIKPAYRIVTDDFMLFCMIDIICSFLIIVHRHNLGPARVKKYIA